MKLIKCSEFIQWLIILLALIQVNKIQVYGERLRDRMYSSINGTSCFRRLNGTHQVGCSSTQSGSVGVLHLIQTTQDFDFLLKDPPAPPYAPMIPPHLFTRENVLNLKHKGTKSISAIILIDQGGKILNFSHELQCPNQYSSILLPNSKEAISCKAYRTEESWNPWGTGLLYEDLPFPVYFVDDNNETAKLIDCFNKYNNYDYRSHGHRSLCAIEVNSFMSAAVNSEVCMRRTNFINNLGRTRYCDPLEGKNVYATLHPREIITRIDHVNAEEKFIMLTCRMDTTSMFDGLGSGAMGSLFSFAVLVSIAHTLKLLLPNKNSLSDRNLNVMFTIFNGESYDFIGSQRFIYDLDNLAFPSRNTHTTPITFDNIEFVLDLGTFDGQNIIKLHSKQDFYQARELLEKLQHYATSPDYDFKIKFESSIGYKLPPTSAQSFLRRNMSFPVFILNSPPANHFYHSIYDDMRNMNFEYMNISRDYTDLMSLQKAFRYFDAESVQMRIRNISSVIAMSLYEILTLQRYTSMSIVNPILIDEFLYCFLQSADCPLFRAASAPNSLPNLKLPPLRYISVDGSLQESSGWTYRLMGYLLSEKMNVSQAECIYLPYHWYAGFDGRGECRFNTQNYSAALSPAFVLKDYDWSSGQYSTWTESTWSQLSARIFLRPSRTHEIVSLFTGVIVLVISFCFIYLLSSRSEVLFEDTETNGSSDA